MPSIPLLIYLALWQSSLPKTDSAQAAVATGFTAPHRSTLLAPAEPGRIKSLAVNEGDLVSANDLIAALDDGAQQARLNLSKKRAASELAIELARIKQRRFDEDRVRIEDLRSKGKASEAELTAAQADSDAARVQFLLAQYEHELNQLDVELQSRLLDRLAIRAPFSGYVAERLHQVGEAVETRDGIVRLVELDPLIVTVDFPLAACAGLIVGEALDVRPLDPSFSARSGQVEFVNRVADPASQTVRVKLRVRNEDHGWMAGMRVNVALPKQRPPASVRAAIDPQVPGL